MLVEKSVGIMHLWSFLKLLGRSNDATRVYCDIDAETTKIASLLNAGEKENRCSKQQNSPTQPGSVWNLIFEFLNGTRQARFYTQAPAEMVWGWLEEARRMKCLFRQRQRHCTFCVSCRTKAYVFPFFQSFWPAGSCSPSSAVRFTWKCRWRRMALALPRCLCLLWYPLVSAAIGLFCTWQFSAGRCCVQCNWMMWYSFPSCWCQQSCLGPHLVIVLKATKRDDCPHSKKESYMFVQT